MRRVVTFILVAGFLVAFNTVKAQKVAVVSPDEIFSLMPETKKADTTLGQFQVALQDAYKEEEELLNAAYEKFVKDSSKMSAATKDVKRKALQEKINGLQTKQQELNGQLEEKKEAVLKPIREKMLKYIQDVAKEKGYTFVLYREQTIVFPETEDITKDVIAKLGIKKKEPIK
jgi:outer membrane protein